MSDEQNIKSSAQISNALTQIRLGDFSVRLPNSNSSAELDSIIEQVNELAKSLQAQTYVQTQNLQTIRAKIYHFCALAAIVLPLLMVIISYLLGFNEQFILVLSALITSLFSALNYAVYLRGKNLKLACIIHITIAILCYGVAIFVSGGTHSHVIIFAPLLVVIAGLLVGKSAVLVSSIGLILVLVLVETFQSNSLTAIIMDICGIGTIASLIYLYEHLQKQGVANLTAMNAALIREKVLNDQIMHSLDASAIVAITDLSGKIIQVNDNFCRTSGYSENELLGQNHRLINSGKHSKEFFVDLWRTISSGKVWTGEIENRRKDGISYFVQTVITPLRSQEGKIERYLSVRFDVTKEKEVSQQLAEAQRVAKIGSWSYDFEGRQAIWSRQMFDLHGEDFTKAAPNFNHYIEFVHPEDRALWQAQLNECFQFGKPCKIRFRIISKTGRLIWLETLTEIQSDRFGQVTKVRGTSQDVTDLVTAEEFIKKEQLEIKARQRFLDNVLENIPSIVFVKDYRNELRYSLVNKSAETVLGISSSSLLGKNDFELFAKEQAEVFNNDDKEVSAKKDILKINCHAIDTPYGQKLLSTIKVPTFDDEGQPELLIGISQDITEEVQLKEQLELERAKFVQASKLASLGEMSAGIAHEINNPLTIIAGTVRALPKFMDKPQEFDSRIQTVNKSVERISKIVSGLRKFSRTAGSTAMKMHSIKEIVNEALILTNAKLQRHRVLIELEGEAGQQLWCNEIEIEQVLVNLINNSIDAVKNLADRWIKIRVYDNGDETILEVRDSGPLIGSEYRKKLFQPFFTTKPVGEGTGLGLAIVKGILDEHDAVINLRTDLPTTSFVIHFKKLAEKKYAG